MPTALPLAPSLIVCETQPRWSVAWQRALRGHSIDVIETRALVHCEEALAEHPQAFVGIEVTAASLAKVIPALERLRRKFPAAAFLVFTDRELRVAEPFLREAGAFHILYSRRDVPRAVRFVRRHQTSSSTDSMRQL